MATQIYAGSENIPYSDLTITNPLQSADTVQFTSPEYIEPMTNIHVVGEHQTFGGFTLKRPESAEGDYQYTGQDYTRLLNGKIWRSYFNKTIGQVMIDILDSFGMKTGGIKKTTTKHSKLLFKNKKAIDVMHQLANLHNQEFYINSDGVAILRSQPETTEGYVFAHPSLLDYDLTYDITDMITGIAVQGADDKRLYSYFDKDMIAKYGHITDIIEDSSLKTKSAAKESATKEWKEKGKIQFSGNLITPILKDMRAGLWITIIPPSWSKNGTKSYYVQQVKTVINKTTMEQQIELVSGKPAPPSEWIYDTTSTSSTTSSSSSATGTVAAKAKQLGNPRAFRRWIDANVPYKFYYNHKNGHSPIDIVKNPKVGGNCWDQTKLFQALCSATGYKTRMVHTTCKRYRHVNAQVYLDGRWITADCTCSSKNRLV